MNCPVCKDVVLVDGDMAGGLRAIVCRQCGGRWVQSFQYWRWLEGRGDGEAEKPTACVADAPGEDSAAGKLCPECGHFLTRRKVGHDVDFHLDRCNSCGGVWFDANEWEALAGKGLHDKVHFVFSAAWQKDIRDAESAEAHEQRMAQIFGTDDYTKLKDTAEWINNHPQRSTILGYINGG